MFFSPPTGGVFSEWFPGLTTTGTTLTAPSTANTKPSTYTQIVAATFWEHFGILVTFAGSSTAATSTNQLVDIAVGAASSEVIILPDLLTGWSNAFDTALGATYFFPLHIKSGSRISGRLQSQIASDTVLVKIGLVGGVRNPDMPVFDQRVTAYGITAGSSKGTNVTAGNGVFGTAVDLSPSTANKIRYLQVGVGGGSDTTLSAQNGGIDIRVAATSVLTVPYATHSSEYICNALANLLLAHCSFSIPSGVALAIASAAGASNAVQDFALYGMG